MEVTVTPDERRVDGSLSEALIGKESFNTVLVGELYWIGISADGGVIQKTETPLKMTMDVSHVPDNLKGKLSGVIYDDSLGSYKQLGGTLSDDGKTFTFFAYGTGTVGAIISDNLRSLRLTVGKDVFSLNGKSAGMGTAPFISDDGRMLVPLRAISEGLGGEVIWDAAAKTVRILKDGRSITLRIGEALPNGHGMPVISNESVLVPVRYVSEYLGANVVWNESDRTIQIYQ
jgi:hypothetical protein